MKMTRKTKRVVRRFLSALAVLTIVCQIPAGAVTFTENAQAEATLAVLNDYPEDTSLRTEIEKHFRYGENGYIAAVYTDPVHYLDSNNEWKDIDNTLKLVAPSGDAVAALSSTGSYYENTANSFKVRLPQALSGTANIQIQHEEHSLRFRMLNTSGISTAAVDNTDKTDEKKIELLQKSQKAADAEQREQLLQQAVSLLPNQASGLTYANVQQNTHLVYRIDGQKLKENIILTAPTIQQSFSFVFTYTGLTPVVQEFGAVHFYDVNQTDGEPIFIIEAPYMEDANTQEDTLCMDIDVTVTPTATGCIYTMTPNAEWLNDPARVYPITIDPTATTPIATSGIEDAGVNEYNPTTNYKTVDRMYVGSNYANSTAYESRIYIRFPRVSAIDKYDYVGSAVMCLDHYPIASYQTADRNALDVYDAGDYNWSSSSITWNAQKEQEFSHVITTAISDADISSNFFNITLLAQQWYNTDANNNGLVIMPVTKDYSKTNRVCYFSSDCSSAYETKRPRITLIYFNAFPAVTTPCNYGSYFIWNVRTGLYLSVANTASTNVMCNIFDGEECQRWRVNTVSDGTYRFTSSVGAFDKYLNAANNDVGIYTNSTSTQGFTLTRHASTNLFYIKFGTKYVSADTDHNVFLSSANMDTSSLWCFVSVYGNASPLYTDESFANPIPDKYKMSKNAEMTTQEGMNLLRTSRVFIANCHGKTDYIDLGNGMITNEDLSALPANDLQGVKLVVYMACLTGAGGTQADNFVNATYSKGAQAVVGFEEPIGAIIEPWCDGFMASLGAGNTIYQALLDGDEAAYYEYNSYDNMKRRTVRGVINVTVLEG